jgi:hypothetical protein
MYLAHRAWIPTFRVLRFMRMSSLRFSVMGWYSASQAVFSGVSLCCGTLTCSSRETGQYDCIAGPPAATVSRDSLARPLLV